MKKLLDETVALLYARKGIEAEIIRLTEIRDSLDHHLTPKRQVATKSPQPHTGKEVKRKLTVAQRKEISRRMKARWAALRKAQG